LPRASSMASKILDRYGNSIASLSLVPSSGGVYDIFKDDIMIFSKKEEGRFPEIEEVYNLLDS